MVCMASNSETHKGETVDLVDILEKELDDKRVKVFGKEDIENKQRFNSELKGWFEKR